MSSIITKITKAFGVLAIVWSGCSAGAGPSAPAAHVEGFRAEPPNLICPLALIIDDGAPITASRLSVEEVAKLRAEGKELDNWTALDDFVSLCKEFGVKGKFTMLSYQGRHGLIDTVTDPQLKKRLDTFFEYLKTHLMPNFDITPEIISHGMVINIDTGQPLARQYSPEELIKLAAVNLHGKWRFSLGKSWPGLDVPGQKTKEPAGEDTGVTGHWEKVDFDDAGWSELAVPGLWNDQGFPGKNGYGWFRRRFRVPAEAGTNQLYLAVMGIEHPSSIYLNGELIGPEKSRRLDCIDVTSRLKRDADNLIVLRISDFDKRGGVTGCIQLIDFEIQPALYNESNWSQTQDEDTLEKYIGRALLALKNVGIVANGVTSPWEFGARNEGNYARAVGRALKRVNGIKGGWYFLSLSNGSYIEPRLMCFDWCNGEYVVSIPADGRMVDMIMWGTVGKDVARQADVYITADGQGGILPTQIANHSYCILCGHGYGWHEGVKVYREVFSRLRKFHNDKVQWMTCSAIARYYAVSKTFRLQAKNETTWDIQTAVPCPDFTISFKATAAVRRFVVNGTELKKDEAGGLRLKKDFWRQQGDTVYVCFDIEKSVTLKLEF